MPNYVMVFRSQPDRRPSDAEEQVWGEWLGQISGSISDAGNRVGQARSLSSDGTAAPATVLGGYVVITADDLDAAAELAGGCPGLRQGGGVEVGEFVGQ